MQVECRLQFVEDLKHSPSLVTRAENTYIFQTKFIGRQKTIQFPLNQIMIP